MNTEILVCPNCNNTISLTETLVSDITVKLQKEFSVKLQKQEHILKTKETELDKEKIRIEQLKNNQEHELQSKLKVKEKELMDLARKEVSNTFSLELNDLKAQSQEDKKKLELAQANELELRKQQRELEDKSKNLDLELQRKLDEERSRLSDKVKRETLEENRMKMLEKEKQITIMQKTIEDLKRQSEQGSMQIQGEVQEDDLKHLLKTSFPIDTIEDVATGTRGADLVQIVNSQYGSKNGVILWESKNTKSWSPEWIKKLKTDQSIVKADICVLVSKTLPEGIETFGIIEGIWVCSYKNVIALTHTLRIFLAQINSIRKSQIGVEEKMQVLYSYLTGSQFKNRVESVVTAFNSMKQDLESERRAMQKIWAKRDKEIERVIFNMTGLYGDLQGISGNAMQDIKSLDLMQLGS